MQKLLLHRSGEFYPVQVVRLQPRDLEQMKKKDGWTRGFNWGVYFQASNVEMYKLLAGNDQIQGVIAMEAAEGFVEVHLVESAPHNRGVNREFSQVGAHLFAFACRRSIELGNEGFVVFTAKTKLIEHYRSILGAKPISSDGRMVIDDVAANRLISVYLR
ncbi:hypothetical protein [Paenibacillus sp. GYB003]|uniref:hypothetical protein n=1 Tax=Paenibacillus sp. GYB003 TaxID=2994392 RepID=UPI002F961DE8